MSTILKNEQMEAAYTLAAELRAEMDPALTVTQNMERSLRMRMTDLDAEKVVRELCAGIDNFHNALEDAKAQGLDGMIRKNVDKILEELTEEQQRTLMMNILQTCAAVSDDRVPENMDLETMKEAACTCIGEYSLILTGSDAFEKMTELDAQTMDAITQVSQSAQDEALAALAVYMLSASGDLDSHSENLDAEQIGAKTAAALAAHSAVVEAAEAETEYETAEETEVRYAKLKTALKLIGGALAITVFTASTVLGVLASSAVAVLGFEALYWSLSFGEAIASLAIITLALINGYYIAHSGVQSIVQAATDSGVAAGVAAAYQKSAEFVKLTLIPSAKNFWRVLREKMIVKAGLAVAAAGSTVVYEQAQEAAAVATDVEPTQEEENSDEDEDEDEVEDADEDIF